MDTKTMLEQFGVTDESALLKVKSTDRQTRIFSVKKPSLVEMSEDECKKLCDKIGVKFMPGYEKRVMQYIVSNETVDRYGDIVRARGVKSENYMNNPVIQFAHNYSTPPVGNSLKVWVDKVQKNVQAWGLFLDDSVDTSGLADLVFRMASSGFMRACSIGFMPLKAYSPTTKEERDRLGLGTWGVEYQESDMLEWSPCGIPANPAALQNAMKDMGTKLQLDRHHIDAAAKYNIFENLNLLDRFTESLKEKGVIVDVHVEVNEDEEEDEEPETPETPAEDNLLAVSDGTKLTITGSSTENIRADQYHSPAVKTEEPAAYIALTKEQFDALSNQPVNVNIQLDIKELTDTVQSVRAMAEQMKTVAELILKKNADAQTIKPSLYDTPAPKKIEPLLSRPGF